MSSSWTARAPEPCVRQGAHHARRPDEGVLDGFAAGGAELSDITTFTHGTTLGLNALLTRTGARTAVVGTRGFRDVYLLGRTDRTAPTTTSRTASRRRWWSVTTSSRSPSGCDFEGNVLVDLDEASARAAARHDRRRGSTTPSPSPSCTPTPTPTTSCRCARCSPKSPRTSPSRCPHELSREYREYERTSTAVLDAYVKPIVRRYLEDLEGELDDRGFAGQFLMTRSGGGAMTAALRPRAARQPDPVRPGGRRHRRRAGSPT